MSSAPDVIGRYLRASDEQDWDALVSCFTHDAIVVDEGNTYKGRDEIRSWREETAAKYTFTSTLLEIEKVGGDQCQVTSLLRGNFPGGEATLTSTFSLNGGLIAEVTMT